MTASSPEPPPLPVEWHCKLLPPDGGRAFERRRCWASLAATLRQWIETYGDVTTLGEWDEEHHELAESLTEAVREARQPDPDPPPNIVRWNGGYIDYDFLPIKNDERKS